MAERYSQGSAGAFPKSAGCVGGGGPGHPAASLCQALSLAATPGWSRQVEAWVLVSDTGSGPPVPALPGTGPSPAPSKRPSHRSPLLPLPAVCSWCRRWAGLGRRRGSGSSPALAAQWPHTAAQDKEGRQDEVTPGRGEVTSGHALTLTLPAPPHAQPLAGPPPPKLWLLPPPPAARILASPPSPLPGCSQAVAGICALPGPVSGLLTPSPLRLQHTCHSVLVPGPAEPTGETTGSLTLGSGRGTPIPELVRFLLQLQRCIQHPWGASLAGP